MSGETMVYPSCTSSPALRLGVLGLTIAATLLAAGCWQAENVPVGGSCTVNGNCSQNLVCTMGKCHDLCATSMDCGAGQSCITASDQTRVCQLRDEAHCTDATDCPMPLICAIDQRCRNSCQTDVDCPAGQSCATSNVCAEGNQVDSDKNLFALDAGVDDANGTLDADADLSATFDADRDVNADGGKTSSGMAYASSTACGMDAGTETGTDGPYGTTSAD